MINRQCIFVVFFSLIFLFIINFKIIDANDLCDVNNDDQTGVPEAVFALQVASGVKDISVIKTNRHSLDADDGSPEEALYVNSSGHVGVGTKNPTSDLDITGKLTKKLSGHVGVPSGSKIVTGVGTYFYSELNIGDSVLINKEKFLVSEIQSNNVLILDTPHQLGANNESIFSNVDLFSVKNGDSKEVFTINKTGYIGIGTNNPKVSLDVNGDVKLGDPVYYNYSESINVEGDGADKFFIEDSSCTIGVVKGAVFNHNSGDYPNQGAICCCLNASRGHGWFCWE